MSILVAHALLYICMYTYIVLRPYLHHALYIHIYLFTAACPAGTYRSATDPVTSCLPCPNNTVTTGVAVAECPCLSGFYRSPSEGPGDGCTGESFKVKHKHPN